MAPRMAPAAKSVDDYLANVPPRFRKELLRLRKTIRAAAPEAHELLSYSMPAFRQRRILVYYAAFEDHCSLFVPGSEIRRKFAAELKPFLAGKGTIRFTPERPLPEGLVTRLVKAAVAQDAAKRSR